MSFPLVYETRNAFKKYYSKGTNELVFKDFPLYDRLRKMANTTYGGEQYVRAVITGSQHGVGTTRAGAQANAAGPLKVPRWAVDHGKVLGGCYITDEEIRHSQKDSDAFFRVQLMKLDEANRAHAMLMSHLLWAGPGRGLGFTGTESSGVVTVSVPGGLVEVEEGMALQASANDGSSTGHSLLGSGSVGYVIAVDRIAGTFTVSTTATGSAGTPTGWTGTMYFFRQGTFGGTSTPDAALGGGGLRSWLPATVSATAFNGIDRTADRTKLAGVYLDSTAMGSRGNLDRIKLLLTRVATIGMKPVNPELWVAPEYWDAIANELEIRGLRNISNKDSESGLTGIDITSGGITARLYSDPHCPPGEVFEIDASAQSIEIFNAGALPSVMDEDGLTMVRVSNEDVYEHRLVAYPGLCVAAPGRFGRGVLAAV